jgi:integrase/recombinase XerD
MKTYLEVEEVAMIEKTAINLRDSLLIRILFRLGCRVSEALAIKVDDIDFQRGVVTIKHLKSRIKLSCPQCKGRLGRRHQFCPVCGAKVQVHLTEEYEHRRIRTLPVDRDTLKMLADYISSQKIKELVFPVNRHRAWQIVRQSAARAGLPTLVNPETGRIRGVSPHRLRDAFAVHAVKQDDSGDGLRLLQEHLGHVSFNTTAKYRKVAGEEHQQWYERLWSRGTS